MTAHAARGAAAAIVLRHPASQHEELASFAEE
jgi:hypothetical protein